MSLSPACSSSMHATCPGYYKVAVPCDCSCHRQARPAAVQPTNGTLVVYTPDVQAELIRLLGIKGSETQRAVLFKLAEHYQLSVLDREISLIPEKGPFIGVWGRLRIGQRSNDLDGFEADDETEDGAYYKVRCVLWRKSMSRPAAKVIGRVRKSENKAWPFEIARARAVRTAFGYAFNIHDAYDQGGDDWTPAPDERLHGTVVDEATGEITAAAPEEVSGVTAAAPKRRRKTQPPAAPTESPTLGEVHAATERKPGPADQDNDPAQPMTERAGTEPGAGPDPPTLIAGGHSLAQRIAIMASYAGIDDDETRHGVIRVTTRGQYQRGTDIPEDAPAELVDRILAAFEGLGDGSLYMRYDEDGNVRGVYKTAAAR